MRHIFSIQTLYEFALKFASLEDTEALEVLIALIVPVNARLEEEIPESKKTLFDKLQIRENEFYINLNENLHQILMFK